MKTFPAVFPATSPTATRTGLSGLASPLIVTLPETNADFAIPTPPATTTLPVVFDDVSVSFVTLNEPVTVALAVLKLPAVRFPVIIPVVFANRRLVVVVSPTTTLAFAITLFVVMVLVT